jgi:hypothetical protein
MEEIQTNQNNTINVNTRSINDDNFIILDDKIIHINCHRFKLFNRDQNSKYNKKMFQL